MRLRNALFASALIASVAGGTIEAQTSDPPRIDFSGVLFANYQRRTDSIARAGNGGEPGSKFDLERVYLTFRMPAGDRMSIRVTTDVFNGSQSDASYYKGWTMRIKYAYLQWNIANDIAGKTGLNATARIGMLHNVVIDHVESFWPRYLGQADLERTAGFFSSSDVGAAALVTLPSKLGEVYGTIVNGPGYTAADPDRFKDLAVRLTLTPLANTSALGAWGKTFAITPWIYRGKTASKFQNGGTGQVGEVTEGLLRNRAGLFVGAKDPRLTVGLNYAKGTATTEAGLNTPAEPRTTDEVTGELMSGFLIVRPFAWSNPGSSAAKWGVLGRLDNFKPNADDEPVNRFSVVSLFWEPTARVTFSLDQQTLSRQKGSTVPETKTLFLHVQALF